MKYILFFFFTCFTAINLHAQNVTVNGRITNAENGNPIEFANIGVEDTYLGTASDLNGEFTLELSNALKGRIVRVSAVGFKTKSFSVDEWLSVDFANVNLAPVNYGLNEVSVEAKSKIGYGIIKTASNLVSENYLANAFTYKCYIKTFYQGEVDNKQLEKQYVFLLADSKGYVNRNFTDAFKNRNYKITENKVSKKPVGFKDGLTMIDNLINMDIVRCPGNILSATSVHDYDVDIKEQGVYEGDSVWVMNYTCKNPNLLNCGDPEALSVDGTIWISKTNNAILKNKVNVQRKGSFIHGNSFFNPEKDTPNKNIEYTVETKYKNVDGKYSLDTIDYLQKVVGKQQYDFKVYLKVLDIESFDSSITNRQYFNDTEYSKAFWSGFSPE